MWSLWHCVLCPSPVAGAARECGPQHLHAADYTPISDGSVPLHPASCGQSLRPPIAPRHPAPPLPSGPSTGRRGYSTLPGQEHCLQQVSHSPLLPRPFPLLPCPPLPPLQGASAHTPMMMSPAPSPMQQVVQSPYAQPPPGVAPPMQPATPAQQPPSLVARHPPNMVAHTPNMMSQPAPNIVAHHPNMVAPPNVVISQNAMAHLHSPHHVMQDRSLCYAPSPNPMVVPYQMGVQSPMTTIAPVGTAPMQINGGFYSQTVKG